MNDFKIRADKIEDFKKKMGANCMDPYSFACVEGAIKVIAALDAGKSVKEAHDELYGMGLSGFMAGEVAATVSNFHERGDEFRDFWNESWGVSKEKANGGVVNPAIVTIRSETEQDKNEI